MTVSPDLWWVELDLQWQEHFHVHSKGCLMWIVAEVSLSAQLYLHDYSTHPEMWCWFDLSKPDEDCTRKRVHWLSKETIQLIRKKKRLYKKAKRSDTQGDLLRYRRISNMVCRLTRWDHHDHLEEISQQLVGNQRIFLEVAQKCWRTICWYAWSEVYG